MFIYFTKKHITKNLYSNYITNKIMDVLEAIKARRSIRRYLNVPVEWDKIGSIIEAGKSAPSSGNLQNWKFVIVTNKEERKAIAEACLQQYWMSEAPIHIIVVAEPEPAIMHYGVRGEKLYTVQNCAAAVQNMLLEATALGLGSCWIGAFEEDMLKKVIGCTERVRPQAVITIGYAAEKVPVPTEYTLEDVTYLEKWKKGCTVVRDVDAAMGYYSAKVERGVESGKGLLKKIKEKGQKIIER